MILFFGDTQLKSDRPITMDDWNLDKPITDKVSEMCKTMYWISDMIEKHNPETVIFLGDLNEELGKLSLFSIHLIVKAFELIIDDQREFYCLIGNHDTKDPAGLCNSHILIPNRKNIHKILPGCPIKLENMLLASYMPNAREFTELVNSYEYKTIVTHMPIIGMEFNTGYLEQAGLDIKDFEGKEFILGHYHKPEVNFFDSTSILSVGAPMYHDYRDEYRSKRGVVLLDDKGKVSSEANPYTKRYIKLMYPAEMKELSSLIDDYGADKLNIRVFAESGILEEAKVYVDACEFNSSKVLPIKEEKTSIREGGISMETSYKEDVKKYVDMQNSDLDEDKLVNVGLEMIK